MARLTVQQKLRKTREDNRDLIAETIELRERLALADDRAKNADLVAAQAISDLNSMDGKIEILERRGEEIRLELATLRGYCQRINQTDNAHQPVTKVAQVPGAAPVEQEPPKYGLPVVGTFKDSDMDPSQINAYMRNRW